MQATLERIEAQTARLDRPRLPDVEQRDVVDTNDTANTLRCRVRRAAVGSAAVTDLEAAGQRFEWEVER
jgi:hypothetical protein